MHVCVCVCAGGGGGVFRKVWCLIRSYFLVFCSGMVFLKFGNVRLLFSHCDLQIKLNF